MADVYGARYESVRVLESGRTMIINGQWIAKKSIALDHPQVTTDKGDARGSDAASVDRLAVNGFIRPGW